MTPRKNGFLCYAHAGGTSPSRKYVLELQKHLNQVHAQEDHKAWCDQNIEAGDDWLPEIHSALNQAAYAVLFVNIELLESRFITEVELPRLLDAAQRDGLLLIPLRVSECLLPNWLVRIQFLNHDEGPLASMRSRANRDRIYTAVARRVKDHLDADTGGYAPISQMAGATRQATWEPGTAAAQATGLVAVSVADYGMVDLADALSRELANRLERVRKRHRRGERAQAREEIGRLIEDPHWSALDAGLRGRILRTAALFRLVDGPDIEAARALAERALAEDPQGDGQLIAAHLAYHTNGPASALVLLADPASPEARQLKAGILTETGRPEEALAVLEDPESEAESDAGIFRMRALTLLALHRVPEAVEAVDRATALEPDALALRTAKALVDFWRASTPAALELADHPLVPMAFPRALVRVDDRAHSALERAAEHLGSVLAQVPEGSSEWIHWATWRLICLLAAGKSGGEATELAGLILGDRDPVPLWALLWVTRYGLAFDRAAVKGRLGTVSPDQPDFIVHRGVYYELCLADDEPAVVLADLPALRAAFEAAGELDVWRQWHTLALTAAGRIDEAQSEAEAIADERLKLRMRLYIARAEPPNLAAARRLAAADTLLTGAGDSEALLEACNAHAAEGDWAFVSLHADALVAAIPTPAALRLLTSAAWYRGDYRRCMTALDDHRQVFPGDLLPPDLAMLRVRCQRALGDVSEAVHDAREAFERDPTPQGLIELLDAQLQAGDLEGMRQSLRRMLGLDGVPGNALLRAAAMAGQTDRELGIELWRKAAEIGSEEPDFAVGAATIGSSLGLGDETAPWFRRMAELAESGTGGAMALHISQMAEFLRAQWENRERIEQLYRRGEVPVHLLPAGMFPPLSALFHMIPEENRSDPDPLLQPPVLVRHGARPIQHLKRGEGPRGRLIMDITALLTAQDLGLLDRIEAHLAPLHLTPQWHALLLDEIRRLRPIQPERLTAQRRVDTLVRADAIGLADMDALDAPPGGLAALVGERQARELAYARAVKGCLVDFLPLHGPDLADRTPVELPKEWNTLLASPRALLDLALSENLIDEQAHARACGLFGPQPPNRGNLPDHGGELLVSPIIIELLAQTDLLPVFAQRFRLTMPADLWRQMAGELRKWERNKRLADWVQHLVDRIALGLSKGKYRVLPIQRPPTNELDQRMHGLEDLLDYRGEPGDRIWIDDRLLNGYPATGTSGIVGVVEVLDLLQACRAITQTERYEWLARLRAGNHRYIPLEEPEILYWLGHAHSDSGRLVVPPQLEILARYWSACLHPSDALQLEPTEGHPHGELGFVHLSRMAVDRALRAIWSNRPLNPRRGRQRADWLLDRLYVGLDDIQHLIRAADANRDTYLPGSEIGLLVVGAYAMMRGVPPRSESDRTLAEHYLEWICERVVAPRLIADSHVVVPAATIIRQSIAGLLRDVSEPGYAAVLRRWTLRFLRIMPKVLRVELHKDQELMGRLGLAELTVIEIDGLRFAAPNFWTAVEGALRRAVPIVNETGDDKPLTLRLVSPPEAQGPVFELADAKGKVISRGYFEHSEILSPYRTVRLQTLREHPQWWDGRPEGCEAVERMLAEIDAPGVRIRRLEALAAASADDSYLELEAQWRRQKGMRLVESLPPGIDAILTYVRCADARETGNIDPAACWNALARSVPPERGLVERLRRMALLPSALPQEAHNEIRVLDEDACAGLLNQLSALLVDPLGRLHLLDIALSAAESLPDALASAQAQIDHLLTVRLEADIRLMTTLVDVAYRALDATGMNSAATRQAHLLAAWIHAARLAGIMLAGGADSTPITEHLQRWAPFPHRDLYAAQESPFQDLAWPWNVQVPDFLFVGLGAILNQHRGAAAQLDLTAVKKRLNDLLSGKPDPAADVHLPRDPYLLSDLLHCLWGGDRATALAALVDRDVAERFSPSTFGNHIDELLGELAQTPADAHRWMLLWHHVGQARLKPEEARRLDDILARLDLDDTFHQDPTILTPLMDLAARNASDRDRIVSHINRWAEVIDSGACPTRGFAEESGAKAREIFIERLIHWLHGLAMRHAEDPDAEFARLLDDLTLRSRSIAAYLRKPLTNIARHLPYARHRSLRRSLLCARSRPELGGDRRTASAERRGKTKKRPRRRLRKTKRR